MTVPRHWLIHLLRGHSEKASMRNLHQFGLVIAPATDIYQRLAEKTESPTVKREATHMVEKLWSCFPSFCVSPYIGNALEIMAQPLCKALETNLIAREHIINGLSTFVSSKHEQSVAETYPALALQDALKKIGAFADRFLPVLFNVALQTPSERRENVIETIDKIASAAPADKRAHIFKAVLQKLLQSIRSNSDESEALLDIIIALSTHLDKSSITLLWRFITKSASESSGIFQKKVYMITSRLFENESLSVEQTGDLLKVLVTTNQDIKARRPRLHCLRATIDALSDKNSPLLTAEVLQQIVAETLVFVKDSNLKVREEAAQVLVALSRHFQKREGFVDLLKLVSAGLACTDAYYQSGTISALSRILYEAPVEPGDLPEEVVVQLAEIVGLRLHDENPMTAKSIFNFFKVLACCLPRDSLEICIPHLVPLICASRPWVQSKFRRKFRSLVELFCYKLGINNVSPLFPEEHQQLFQYIAKEERRKARARGKKKEAKKLDFDALIRDVDANEEEKVVARGSLGSKRAGVIRIKSSRDGEVIDLLDKNVTRNLVTVAAGPSSSRKRKRQVEDPFLEERDGKIIVFEEDNPEVKSKLDALAQKERSQLKPRRLKRRRIQNLEEKFAERQKNAKKRARKQASRKKG